MKKYLISLILMSAFTLPSYAATEDTSIIDELDASSPKLETDFKLQKFSSCDNIETVMNTYLKKYYESNPYPYYYRGGMIDDVMLDGVDSMAPQASEEKSSISDSDAGSNDYSQTNVQVAGVDESDIVKTDGTYIYYMSDSYDYTAQKQSKYVFIAKAVPGADMEVIRKIKLPDSFYGTDLYITDNRLAIISTGYNQHDYGRYWVNRNQKTFVMVFDKTDINNMKLLKLYAVDGNYSKSRKIDNSLYVISTNSISFPYWGPMVKGGAVAEDMPEFDIDASMPQEIDITRDESGDLTLKGKKLPYDVKVGDVADCNEVEYFLPDEDTMKKYSLHPNYNIVSMIDLGNTSAAVKNKVIFGSTNEVYMSTDNLYITSYIYEESGWSCPPFAMCIAPWFQSGEHTLIHKLNVDGLAVNYQDSAIVPGNPLTQYSMDEKDGNFRILTSQWSPERQTNLYILDKNLEKLSSLEGLGKGEWFQSSRYIGDKLFLVTFQQIDPLFAIDLADAKNPKILWELKIPGYSTYLHPYDANHLIGLGYDTITNQWGGTQNNGLKVDLYQINYDKECGDSDLTADEKKGCDAGDYKGIIVKQLQTKTFGSAGSYAEALNNPRAFVWNAKKNLLLLPSTLYSSKPETPYQYTDFFNGLLGISITPSGISEKFRVTQIDTAGLEEKRQKDCEPYLTQKEEAGQCRKLIDGSTYCPPVNTYYYVPEYCYEGSSIGSYLAQTSWNFSQWFTKRALYIGDTIYGISDKNIDAYDLTGKEIGTVELK